MMRELRAGIRKSIRSMIKGAMRRGQGYRWYRGIAASLRKMEFELADEDRKTYSAACRKMVDALSPERIVVGGPFQGMLYPFDDAIGSPWAPKILGTYECEIHDVIRQIPGWGCSAVLNIGAGEGYYAVGLARLANLPVVAYELDERAHEMIRQLAGANRVMPLITIKGICRESDLIAESSGMGARPLLVIDCEGAELDLVSDAVLQHYPNATLIVETHDGIRQGITPALLRRLKPSHDTIVLAEKLRTESDLHHSRSATVEKTELRMVLDERRGGWTKWIVARPKHG